MRRIHSSEAEKATADDPQDFSRQRPAVSGIGLSREFRLLKEFPISVFKFSLTLDDLTEITGFIAGVTQHSFLFLPVNDRVACDSLVNHKGGFSFSISFLASLNLA